MLFAYTRLVNKDFKKETLDYQFDYQFHANAVRELLRVSKREGRIFPVGNIGDKLHEYVDNLLNDLYREGIAAHIRPVEYEASKGVNQMLCLNH